MKSAYKYIFTAYILALFWSVNIACAQTANWNVSLAPAIYKVKVPATVDFKLPTAIGGTYELGYFILSNNLFSCVGKATITPGKSFDIKIGVDLNGNIGYKIDQRMITLIRNTSVNPIPVYGVEFSYKNGKNYCHYDQSVKLQDSTYIDSLKSASWANVFPSSNLCSFTNQVALDLPFGLVPTLGDTTRGIKISAVNSSSFILYPSKMAAGNYHMNFQVLDIQLANQSYSFTVIPFPKVALHHIDSICKNQVITVDEYDLNNNLTRSLIRPTDKFLLNNAGTYYFNITDNATKKCTTTDTLQVSDKIQCEAAVAQKSSVFVNLSNGDYLNFTEKDEIDIYDLSLKKIVTLQTPAVWKGEDQYGKIMPIGLYFFYNSKKERIYVTLAY